MFFFVLVVGMKKKKEEVVVPIPEFQLTRYVMIKLYWKDPGLEEGGEGKEGDEEVGVDSLLYNV